MAFFRDTISGQIATQNAVNNQMAQQKAEEQRLALQQYMLGKQFGDNHLTGIANREMNNPGLIPNMLQRGLDLFTGPERHNQDVKTDVNQFMPGEDSLSQEDRSYFDRASNLRAKSFEDKVRAYAEQAYADAGQGFDEERFRKDFYSNGRMKRADDLPEHIRDAYKKARTELEGFQKESAPVDADVGLREHMKKHKIDKMEEFSGSHSNMRNQNYKMHKALVDYYVKNKNWDKAQEIQDSFERNEANIDKHWGDNGSGQRRTLFSRPQGSAGPNPIEHGIAIGDENFSVMLGKKSDALDPRKVLAALRKTNPGAAERYAAALNNKEVINIYDASKKGEADLGHHNAAKTEAAGIAADEARSKYWYSKDKRFNTDNYFNPSVKHVFINGNKVLKRDILKNPRQMEELVSQIGIPRQELARSLAGY
jgi:hypothetical protein